MPDWTQRILKSRAQDISGETLIAASYFLGRGSTSAQILFGAVTSVGGAAFNRLAVQGHNEMLESARDGYHSPPGSLAAGIPDSKGIMAVTDKSLIVFGYRLGFFSTSIEDPVTRIDRAHLVGWSLSPGKMASVQNLAFDDGSTQGIELPIANRPADFAAALDIPVLDCRGCSVSRECGRVPCAGHP